MKATKKRSMGQAKWSKNEQESNIDAKNPISHCILKNQVQIIRLFSDYFNWVNKKPPCLGVQNAKKVRQTLFFQQEERKTSQKLTTNKLLLVEKNSVYNCFLNKVLEFCLCTSTFLFRIKIY